MQGEYFICKETPKVLFTELYIDLKSMQTFYLFRTIRYAGDVKDNITAEEALIAVPKLKVQLQRSQKTVKFLRGKNKRLRDQMTSLKDLFYKLKSKNLISDLNNTVLQVMLRSFQDHPIMPKLNTLFTIGGFDVYEYIGTDVYL